MSGRIPGIPRKGLAGTPSLCPAPGRHVAEQGYPQPTTSCTSLPPH